METSNQNHDDNEIKIRIFGSKECYKCKSLSDIYTDMGYKFDFIDANADENESICDKYDIDELPHVQVFRAKSGTVLIDYKGFLGPVDLNAALNKILGKSTSVNNIKTGNKNCDNCNKQNST